MLWLNLDLDSCWVRREESERINEDYKRPHALWAHAERLIAHRSSELALSDAVLALNRSVRLRLESLERTYSFASGPGVRAGARALERLAHFGVIRPLILRRLINIRNNIEHADVPPLAIEELESLLDTVWYFLRSTDNLACYRTTALAFYPEDHEGYYISVSLGTYSKWEFEFGGWLPAAALSSSPVDGGIKARLFRKSLRQEIADAPIIAGDGRGRLGSDVSVEGTLIGPEEKLRRVAEIILTSPE